MDKPTWTPIWLACRNCEHQWDDWQPSMVPFDTYIAHIGTYRCPQCKAASGDLVMRTNPLTAP